MTRGFTSAMVDAMERPRRGTFIAYVPKKFNPRSRELLERICEILDEYESKGYAMSLRQLYYQLVTRGHIPNEQAEYQRVGNLVNDGRLAGYVSWTSLEDRNRGLRGHRYHDGPGQAIAAAAREYKIDLWADQRFRPEVWVEKAAMEGVIGGICSRLRVDFFATRGYNSQSEQWRAARRFAGYVRRGQVPIVIHLADHDPSGVDMTEDLRSRFRLFTGLDIVVDRIALTMDQIRQYSLAPDPAKKTDSRYAAYRRQYGESSWEMDALDPPVIEDLIRRAILRLREEDKWDRALAQEVEDLRLLEEVAGELGAQIARDAGPGEDGEDDG